MNASKPSSNAMERPSDPTGPSSELTSHLRVPKASQDPILAQIKNNETKELDLTEEKVVNRVLEKYVFTQEDLDEEALEIEDNKIIDKCLELLQSQFAEEDEEDEENEETKIIINEVTEKIALENLEEAEKEGDKKDAEEEDGNPIHLRRSITAHFPGGRDLP
ncbi:hypothetical protein MJO28_007642 [Puccinia striiformis f. sp. tritici]|uniref:Uncharacterized protein n=1 Tax=Puccinia striiformis f. sp. tritici TaxID=168172 RepID=A0ACC0EGA0_9BASI|nr:hypothetical protein MJO28_007642 [Puccinia striiformis f. sp. tritici]